MSTQLIELFNSTLKRISKELNNTNIQLEEVFSEYLEDQEKDQQIAEMNKTLTNCEAEKLSLVKGLINILDGFEDLYSYSLKYEHGSWPEQMQLLWNNFQAILSLQGIIRIEGKSTLFNAKYHSAIEVREDNNTANGMILEVLRSGYIYQSQLLRKAQVIVNKTDGG